MAAPMLRTLFLGSDLFSLASLKALFLRSQQASSCLKSVEVVVATRQQCPVKTFAIENNLRLHSWPLDDNSITGQFDVAAVVSFGHLLPDSFLDQFPLGAVNVHPSLLPRWRGAAPLTHTILAGDEQTGVTLLEVSRAKFDAGKILHQKPVKVPSRADVKKLSALLAVIGADMLVDCLENLDAYQQRAYPQPKAMSTWAHKLGKDVAIVRWKDFTATDVDRRSRALADRFLLRTSWNRMEVRLRGISTAVGCIPDGVCSKPGTIFCRFEDEVLYIKCKDDWISVAEVLVQGEPDYISAQQFAYESFEEFTHEDDCFVSSFDVPD